VGGPAGGFGRAVLCARTGAGGVRSFTERHFSSAYSILRTRIVWVTCERKSSSEIASHPRARIKWDSNSELEFNA